MYDNINTTNELKEDTIVGPKTEPSKMKQLELNFVNTITEEWTIPIPNPNKEPEGRKEQKQKRKKHFKKLAKENTKVTDWLNTNIKANIEVSVEITDNDTEEAMEIEIACECGQQDPVVQERLLKRDMMIETWRSKRMIREMVVEIVRMIPWTSL